MKSDNFIIGQLARISYIDGQADGLNGMLGVAFTIRNRVRAGWWDGSWSDILSHHQDYSSRIEPIDSLIPDTRHYNFNQFLMQVDNIFNGSLDDFVTIKRDASEPGFASIYKVHKPPVALYYARLNEITSDKFLINIPRQPQLHPLIAQVGSLSFFG